MFITSSGNVFARDVKVTLSIIPDYVFFDDYQLATLAEVEEHILKYGHLKGVPAEKEGLKNGMEVSEMYVVLLEKIEELTLYAIEQEKQIQALQKELERPIK